MHSGEIWKETLDYLQGRMNRPAFEMVMKNIEPLELENDLLTLQVTGPFAMEYFQSYKDEIQEAASLQARIPIQLDVVYKELDEDSRAGSDRQEIAREAIIRDRSIRQAPRNGRATATLNDLYIFDTFVMGESNQFCYNTSRAVAEKPGSVANPLFIYGDVGLGKTHLLHAIGNYVIATRPDLKVIYRHSMAFVNEVMNYIKDGRFVEFRNSYLHADLLLIDDIHYLKGKEGSQNEFFQLFNTFYENKKQIVVTCDRPPKELVGLEERVVSRLGWGVIADISSPNYETRLAILKRKLEKDNFLDSSSFPEEVLDCIASNICTNIRDLEGVLTSVLAKAKYNHQPVTISLAEEIINNIAPLKNPSDITPQSIIGEVCGHYNVKTEAVLGKSRKKEIVIPRMVSMYLIRDITKMSFMSIAEIFEKDHTSVLYSCEKVADMMAKDPFFKKTALGIKERITG